MKSTAKNVHPSTLAVRGNGYYCSTRATHRQAILFQNLLAPFKACGLRGRPGFLTQIRGGEALKLLNVIGSRPQTLSAESIAMLGGRVQRKRRIMAEQYAYQRHVAEKRAFTESVLNIR